MAHVLDLRVLALDNGPQQVRRRVVRARAAFDGLSALVHALGRESRLGVLQRGLCHVDSVFMVRDHLVDEQLVARPSVLHLYVRKGTMQCSPAEHKRSGAMQQYLPHQEWTARLCNRCAKAIAASTATPPPRRNHHFHHHHHYQHHHNHQTTTTATTHDGRSTNAKSTQVIKRQLRPRAPRPHIILETPEPPLCAAHFCARTFIS